MRHIAKIFACSAMTGLLIGCASTEEQAKKSLDETGQVPRNANYKDMHQYPGNVTCGKYLATDYQGFPDLQGFCRHRYRRQSQPKPWTSTFIAAKTQAAALDSELAIDYESQKLQIDSILEDFRLLAEPLEAYIRDNPAFPWTEQGLQALVKPRQRATPQELSRKAVTSSSIPTDPGARDYDYVCEPFAGVAIPYKLQSLGADGVEGGGTAKMRTSSIATCPTSTTSTNCRSTEPSLGWLKRKYFGQKQQDDRAVN